MTLFFPTITSKKPTANRFLVVVLSLIWASMGCIAQESTNRSNRPVLGLSEAVQNTLEYHPDLQAIALKTRVLDGQIQQAGVGVQPQVGLVVEDAFGTGEFSAFKSSQSTLTISWVLQHAQLEGRVSAIRSEAATNEIEKQIKALDLSAQVANQYIHILVKQERLKLEKRAKALAEQVIEAVQKRVTAGKSSSVELELAKVELIRKELNEEDLEHEIRAHRYRLASFWGEPHAQFQLNGDLLALPTIPSIDTSVALLKQNPQLQQFVTAKRIAQSQIQLAKIEAKPQVQLSAGLRRFEATDDIGFVAGVSIPLGGRNRNAGQIAALAAQQDVLEQERAALLLSLDTQLYVILQEMMHSKHVIETIKYQIVPALETALSEASIAFEQGQLNYNQLSQVQKELLTANVQLLDAYESLHLKHIEIQRLTGSTINQ